MERQPVRERRLLRKSAVREAFGGIGATTLWQWMRDGRAPQPCAYLSPVLPVWDADAVYAAVARIADAAPTDAPDAPAQARAARKERRARSGLAALARGAA